MAALAEKEPEIVDESDGDDDVPEDAYDVLESALCGEYGSEGHTVNMSQSVKNDVKNAQRAAHKAANIGLCQDTRATTEQVLDPRTRLILFKLLQRNAFAKLEGCLSTGKEANVYYALSGDGLRDIEATKDVSSQTPLAVKVYKTSILVFRDRRRYVDGEHRFEKGYTSGKNPRKMVQLWAEKELRNYKRCCVGVGIEPYAIDARRLRQTMPWVVSLSISSRFAPSRPRRLQANGVRAPRPLLLKGHVLVMEFIGSAGWPAPRLHDASLSTEQMEDAYVQTCVALRAMFARCKLVHGDFSEYNLLWFENEVVVIDVSQSVEWDHPRATEFLRKDCSNVRDFFSRKCDRVLSVKALYDFVMRDGVDDDAGIRAALDVARSNDGVTDQEDRVFMDAFLPRSLQDLGSWPEAAQRAVASGDNETGFDEAVGDLLGANVCSDDDASAATRSESDDEDDGVHGRLPDPSDVAGRASAKEAKRAAAKLQKEERREKRKTKLKKHLKKKATKRGR